MLSTQSFSSFDYAMAHLAGRTPHGPSTLQPSMATGPHTLRLDIVHYGVRMKIASERKLKRPMLDPIAV